MYYAVGFLTSVFLLPAVILVDAGLFTLMAHYCLDEGHFLKAVADQKFSTVLTSPFFGTESPLRTLLFVAVAFGLSSVTGRQIAKHPSLPFVRGGDTFRKGGFLIYKGWILRFWPLVIPALIWMYLILDASRGHDRPLEIFTYPALVYSVYWLAFHSACESRFRMGRIMLGIAWALGIFVFLTAFFYL